MVKGGCMLLFTFHLLLYHRHFTISYIIDGGRFMTYFNVLKEIKQGKLANIYLLFGTESYFIQSIIDKLIIAALGDETDNLSTYDLSEISIQNVIQDAQTYPFFGDQKLIIANNAT